MENEIEMFVHCRQCLESKPEGVSPADWSRLECGFTPTGFQVWCLRCEISVVQLEVGVMELAEGSVEERGELH